MISPASRSDVPPGTAVAPPGGPATDLHLRRLAALADPEMQRTDVTSLLAHVAATVTELLPTTAASVILWDDDLERFVVSASTLPEQPASYVLDKVRDSGGASRWILEHRRPLAVPDIDDDPFSANEMLRKAGLRAYLGVPLVFDDRAIGVLYALDRLHREYDPADMDFMTILARRAAGAIGLARTVERLERLTRTDELTGAANRREYMSRLQRELERRRRGGRPLSIAVLDIDHFKVVNDERGHHVGDEVLAQVARRCSAVVRANDVFARLGGEEFGVVLPDTEIDAAATMADRLRAVVESEPVVVPCATTGAMLPPVRVTATFGVAEHVGDEPRSSLLQRADRAMYTGKGAGRNRITLAPPPDPEHTDARALSGRARRGR